MEIFLFILIGFLYSVFSSFWRRTFGGGIIPDSVRDKLDKWHISVRFLSEICYIGISFLAFYFFVCPGYWLTALIIPLITLIAFWLPGHGPFFDIGRDKNPDPSIIERYNKEWYTKILYYLFKPEYYYGEFFDFCGMMFRYCLPTILLIPFYGISVVLLGFFVAIIYGICWAISDHQTIHHATNYAEFICGFICGLFLYFDPLWLIF